MKFRDLDGQFKDIVIKTGDTLPVGSVVEYEGSTPPAGWSKLSDGGSVIVSSEEPTTGEEVWLQRSNNIFNKNNYDLFKGYMSSENRNFVANNNGYLVYIPCIPNTDYIVTREVLENNFQVGSGNIVPVNNGQVTQVILAETSSRVTIKTGENDTYLYIYVKYDGNSSYTLEQILDSLRVEISKKIHTKNDKGYEEFYNEEDNKYKTIWQGSLKGTETLSLDLTKYKSLKVYFHSFACTGIFEVDLTRQVSNVLEDNFKYVASYLSGYYSTENSRWESHFCEVGVSADKLTFKNMNQGYFFGTTFNERNTNAAYHVYKIEGLK